MNLFKNKNNSKNRNYMEDEDGREIAISVEHLTMEFKVSKDKIDTLKEYIIRTLKRNKVAPKKVRILDDISFKVYKGERLGVLGFNGAGKSTLLKIISGIYEPTEGEIKINGKIAPLLALSAGFDKNYSGKNNIYLNGAFLSMTEDYIDEHFDEIVEFSELGESINYPVKNYSSGMKSKLGFSIATTIKPDILIIDEILGVGDIKFKKKSNEKIKSMMEEGVSVLLVTHSLKQIKEICDRCIWIENGKLLMEGETKKVVKAYKKNANKDKKKSKKKKKSKDKSDDDKKSDDKKSKDKKSEDKKTEDKKSDDKKSKDKKTEDKKSDDKKSKDKKTEDKKSDDKKSEDKKTEDKKSEDKKTEDKKSDDKKSDDEKN